MFINYFENDKNESLVSYKEHRIYRFRKDKSNGLSLDDKVTVINLPVLVCFQSVHYLEQRWPTRGPRAA
jgi:hypothetical protein